MKLIILDRDGVINEDSDEYIKSPDEWLPIPGSMDAIAHLSHAGYQVYVLTNQSGLARGLFDLETLHRMHTKMQTLAREAGGYVDGVFFCPDSDDASPCRKPNPGLFQQLSRRLGVTLHGVPAVGDSLRDIQAARRAGARPILVRTGKGERTLAGAHSELTGVPVFANLRSFVAELLDRPLD